MNPDYVAHKLVTTWACGGRLTPTRLKELTEEIAAAIKAENAACADLARGCAIPALAEAILKRLQS